jgi:hypothetical protein
MNFHHDNDRPMDARAASTHLDALGYPTAPATLAKLRCVGGGPRFIRFGRSIRYRPSALADWIAQRARDLRNTSEAT